MSYTSEPNPLGEQFGDIKMGSHLRSKLENSVVRNKIFLSSLASYAAILAIFMNLNSFQSPLIGFLASVIYFLINGVFLGNAFFEKEATFFRLMFGILLLIMLLGFVSWVTVVCYNLDIIRFTLVLFVVATVCSLLNSKVKHKNAV